MKPFFNTKDTQVWSVKLDCVQDHDDDSPHEGDNLFKLTMHRSPGGGYYWRVDGEVAFDFVELDSLKNQLDKIAEILEWD